MFRMFGRWLGPGDAVRPQGRAGRGRQPERPGACAPPLPADSPQRHAAPTRSGPAGDEERMAEGRRRPMERGVAPGEPAGQPQGLRAARPRPRCHAGRTGLRPEMAATLARRPQQQKELDQAPARRGHRRAHLRTRGAQDQDRAGHHGQESDRLIVVRFIAGLWMAGASPRTICPTSPPDEDDQPRRELECCRFSGSRRCDFCR
jgi:hypothetical protein